MSETVPLPTPPSLDLSRSTRSPDPTSHARPTEVPVDPMFRSRWSPRAFTDEPVTAQEAEVLFEAARWAPSAGNEQPWLFVYGRRPEDRARLVEGLLPMNQLWASRAPMLVYLFARKLRRDLKPYPHAPFDAGAAWMSLALQAHRRGLAAHAMGGIDPEKVYGITGVDPEQYQVLVGIAVGHPADPGTLPPALAEREAPSPRRPQREFVWEGRVAPGSGGRVAER